MARKMQQQHFSFNSALGKKGDRKKKIKPSPSSRWTCPPIKSADACRGKIYGNEAIFSVFLQLSGTARTQPATSLLTSLNPDFRAGCACLPHHYYFTVSIAKLTLAVFPVELFKETQFLFSCSVPAECLFQKTLSELDWLVTEAPCCHPREKTAAKR